MKKIITYSLCLALFAGLLSCKKKYEKASDPELGTDVQPESDGLSGIISDTTTFKMHVIQYDSSRSYQDQFKYIGSNQDPVFGRTNASVFTNISMPAGSSNIGFGEDAVLDSAELILTFTQSFVGDSTTALLYQVHQLTQSLERTKAYYLNNTVAYSSNLLCSATRRISKTSGFYTIRVPIDQAFASAILTNTAYLVNNTTFQNTYKGFYITTKNSSVNPSAQGALMKIDLDNPVSGLYMYYHNGAPSSSKEPKTYRFPFSGDNSSRFNNIQYDPNSGGNGLLLNQLTLPNDTNYWNTTMFLKGVAGTKVKIEMPFLKNYSAESPIAVNRAELVFRVDQSFISANNYQPPSQMSLVAIDEYGKEVYVKDQYFAADLLKFGGNYDPINKHYIFNIARHMQDIMSGKIANYGFYLVIANPDRSYVARRDDRAERVIFGGIKSAMYKPTFRLTYIRFPYDK